MTYQDIINNLNLNDTYELDVRNDASSDDLMQYLENVYNDMTDDSITKYKVFKQNKDLNTLNNYKNNLSENVKDMHNDATTNKRLIEIKINKGRRLEYIMNILKICLVISACMVVFPILNKLNILNKTTAFIMWGMCTLIMILVI